jgi:hypothetical protein
MSIVTPRKPVLVAFDAFGTIFSPRFSIAVQYMEVARAHGITDFDSRELAPAFKQGGWYLTAWTFQLQTR